MRQTKNHGPVQESTEQTITRLLLRWTNGHNDAIDDVVPRVLDELRRTAGSLMSREAVEHTLEPTALVHELYLRLRQRRTVQWRNRSHFFAFAAQAMRRILVDHARTRGRKKRRAGDVRVPLDEALQKAPPELSPPLDYLALDEALNRLDELEPRQCRVVEMRFFLGLSAGEIAEILEVNSSTVHRDWMIARAWLYRELTRRETC